MEDQFNSTNQGLTGVISLFSQIDNDESTPKNTKTIIKGIIKDLENIDEKDLKIKVDAILQQLDAVIESQELHPYTRTQIWNVINHLETLQR
jgi:uncharacterized protein (UPF0147 family)